MSRKKKEIFDKVIGPDLDKIHSEILSRPDISVAELCEAYKKSLEPDETIHRENIIYSAIGIIFVIVIAVPIVNYLFAFLLGIRCFIPNNYLVWEATRPITNCAYCRVKGPLILPNMTREEFLVNDWIKCNVDNSFMNTFHSIAVCVFTPTDYHQKLNLSLASC